MPTTPVLPLPDGLESIAVSETAEELLVRVISTRPSSPCPVCSTPSAAVHSSYRRKPLDLPCAGRRIRLFLSVRKFFCRVSTYPRKVFTERRPLVPRTLFSAHEPPTHDDPSRRVRLQWQRGDSPLQAVGHPALQDNATALAVSRCDTVCRTGPVVGIDDFGATRKVACVAVRTHERRLLPGVLPPLVLYDISPCRRLFQQSETFCVALITPSPTRPLNISAAEPLRILLSHWIRNVS